MSDFHVLQIWQGTLVDNRGTRVQCVSLCSQVALTWDLRHTRTHKGDQPYTSDSCNFRVVSACAVKRHRRKHTGENPYRCDLCAYRGACSTYVIEHRRIHTKETPFNCTMWGNLMTHIKQYTAKQDHSSVTCAIIQAKWDHWNSTRQYICLRNLTNVLCVSSLLRLYPLYGDMKRFIQETEKNLSSVWCVIIGRPINPCGEMKPLRVMSIHKSVYVTSFNDVLTEARGNNYADSTLISYVMWSPQSSVLWHLNQIIFHFFVY